jgi:hypothetical protein
LKTTWPAIGPASILFLSFLAAAPAHANEMTADAAVTAVEAASQDEALDMDQGRDRDASMPGDARRGLQLPTEKGWGPITIGLPYADRAAKAETSTSGTTTFNNRNGSTTVPVALDGGIQISTVLAHPGAPRTYEYEFSLPDGASIAPDGEDLLILNGSGEPVAVVDSPWARDARGRDIATHYDLSGDTVIQVVEPTSEATYPIVADPKVTYYWWGISTKFDRSTTARLAGVTKYSTLVATACAYVPLAHLKAACTVILGAKAVQFHNILASAKRRGICAAINIPYPPLTPVWAVMSEERC